MSYRDTFREGQRQYYWTLPRVIIAGTITATLIGGAVWFVSITSQPGRVISKTFDADNVIQNYEYYHDANGNFIAKTAQVRQFREMVKQETDPQEKSRLRIEMAAIQQSCRDLAQRYNANSQKANRAIFKGGRVPEQLYMGDCE